MRRWWFRDRVIRFSVSDLRLSSEALTTLLERPAADDAGLTFAGAGLDDRWRQLSELWTFRELAFVFAERDLKVRYRQAVIGVAWAVLQPLATMGVFLVLFQWLGRTPARAGHPYALVTYIGVVVWLMFASTVRESTASLVGNRDLVTKVYFPRLLLPLATLLCAGVDLSISLVVVAPLMWWFGIAPGLTVLCLPLFLMLGALVAVGVGIWLAALNAQYRDIGYIVPFFLQLGMIAAPVYYETTTMVPERWQWIWPLNPLVAVIEGCRWSLLSTTPPSLWMLVLSGVVTVCLLSSGWWYFCRAEQWIADRI
ncbi:MAG: hypothetical protein B7Z55_05035 [Planctomycetales bacterium 12-60-4]|nr:MAG: hypothetical protein B7Z55_05035 [Planctomycetales bacterium 12-60-4]